MTQTNTITDRKRLHFLDVLLILVLVAALAGVGLLIWRNSNQDADDVTLHYTILIKDLPKTMVIKLEEGQTVINAVDKTVLGTVVSFRRVPCEYDAYNETSQSLTHGNYTDLINLEIEISANAKETDTAFFVEKTRICNGTLLYLRTETFVGSGYVLRFSVS